MSGRLEVGCQAMIVGTCGGALLDVQQRLIGTYGTLTRSGLVDSVQCWDMEGGNTEEKRKNCGYWPLAMHDGARLYDIPACILVRIDDPDVGLDDGGPADKPSIAGAQLG